MLLIIAGIALLYFGAEGLVRGSSNLAIRAGLSPLVVGLTVVAFGTSAPELTVSVSASLQGAGPVALGNVIGSNIFNIAVILGISALICPLSIHIDLLKRDIPIMIGVTLISCILIEIGAIGRMAGLFLLVLLASYIVFTIREAKKDINAVPESEMPEKPKGPWWMDIVFLLVGLGLLVYGAKLFVTGAIDIARDWGISEAVIGLTIVAMGTSLPELATSIVAALKRQTDIAVGNVIGSNMFNLLCILGVTSIVRPVPTDGIEWRDTIFMLGVSILLLPLAFTQKKLARWEGGVFLTFYSMYLWWLWPV